MQGFSLVLELDMPPPPLNLISIQDYIHMSHDSLTPL
jgi:hypothetical protein